jgi:hypothetical protein
LEVRKSVYAQALKRIVTRAARRRRDHRFSEPTDGFALAQIPQRASTTLAARLTLAVKVQVRVVVGPLVTVLAMRCALIHQRFLAVFFDCLNAFAVGAPLVPGFRIFSPEPAAMRFRFALMLAYKPRLAAIRSP